MWPPDNDDTDRTPEITRSDAPPRPVASNPQLQGTRDGVISHAVRDVDMAKYADAREQMRDLRVPVFLHSDNPHERLFVAAFDGTGNNADGPDPLTNVGDLRNQISALNQGGHQRIQVGYVAGPGTQDSWSVRNYDQATGHTYERRLEEMYGKFIDQSARWLEQDPQAQIRLVSVGFSRGAEQAAGFTTLVEERGIQHPASYTRSAAGETKHQLGQVTGHDANIAPLVAPGQVPQAVGLFDPVGSGEPYKHDRRLPPSVLSGLQLESHHERRWDFPVDRVLPSGLSENGRFLNVVLPGAHSDVGGGYAVGGLQAQAGNLMVSYLNTLSDQPFLRKQNVGIDDVDNVIHRSDQGSYLFQYRNEADYRQKPGGSVADQAPRASADIHRNGPWPMEGDERNELRARFEFARVDPDRNPQIGNAVQPNVPSPLLTQSLSAGLNVHTADGQPLQFQDGQRARLSAFAAASASEGNLTRVDAIAVNAQQDRAWAVQIHPTIPSLTERVEFSFQQAINTDSAVSVQRLNANTQQNAQAQNQQQNPQQQNPQQQAHGPHM